MLLGLFFFGGEGDLPGGFGAHLGVGGKKQNQTSVHPLPADPGLCWEGTKLVSWEKGKR